MNRIKIAMAFISCALTGACSSSTTDPEIPDPVGATSASKADGDTVDLLQWEGSATNIFPATLGYTISANYAAHNCELWVTGFGKGNYSVDGPTVDWIEAYVTAPPQDGTILHTAMFVLTGGTSNNAVVLAQPTQADQSETGFRIDSSTAQNVAFFVDVKRPTGEVVRLWQSNDGQNYSVDSIMLNATDSVPLGGGSVLYANSQVSLFDQMRACN